ncbi:MAG: T9SS type A sorting domain-containing protein, partial [Saprospiraceae bacterium]|nr:T9SS type A sorting domain-containing protein [Saprospiraceae bacterium]
LISKHILCQEPLNSPYKMIAADANKSGSITTFDIVELRKLILGIYNELPNNTSWRFVDKSFSFPNANNPFQTAFPETIAIANAMVHQFDQDFVGVKVGDVNATSMPNATKTADDRNVGTAIFDIEDRELKAGEMFEITFKSAQELQGFQFTMLHSGLELLEVVKGEGVNEQNFGQFEGKTTVSVDGAQAFTLQFRATKSGKLSEILGVSGEITRAEGYLVTTPQSPITQSPITQSPVTKLGIAFRFDGKTIAGVGFELYQNQPNPFVHKTSIGFYLPEATEATLSVLDESGRLVYQQRGKFAKGEHTVSLERALLNTTGVLFYKLETATDSATRKMIQSR